MKYVAELSHLFMVLPVTFAVVAAADTTLPSLWFSLLSSLSPVTFVKLLKLIVVWLLLAFVLILFTFVDDIAVVLMSLKMIDDGSDAELVVMINVLPLPIKLFELVFVTLPVPTDAVPTFSKLPEFVARSVLAELALVLCRNAVANCWFCDWLDDTTTR